MNSQNSISNVSKNIRLTIAVFVVLFSVFGLYVHFEKNIDSANNSRQISYQLADQMRQSSDDLTRMVILYVGTGDPRYKKYYQDILDIRDGRKPRPEGYVYAYWDMVLAHTQSPPTGDGRAAPLLDLMRQSGFTDEELGKLTTAKSNSDGLAALEFEAMKLAESGGPQAKAHKEKALAMLLDDHYHQAKAKIMQPINEFYVLMDKRTADTVLDATNIALLFRLLFIMAAMGAIIMLWRTYTVLRTTLGGSVDEISAHITKIGHGDFSRVISVADEMKDSVLGWLSVMQSKLAQAAAERELSAQERLVDEARLNEAQHIAKVGSWELDLITGKLIWSDEIFNLFEIDKTKFAATYEAFLNAIHPDDRDAVNNAYTDSLKSRLPYEITHRLLMSDGRIKWVQEKCVSDFDAEGKPLRSRGTVQDFTELRMAERAAQESALRTQAILNNVLDGIITINERGNIESFNTAAQNIFGYTSAEVIGCNVKMLMPEPYHGEHDGYLHNYVSTGNKKIIGIGRQVVGRRKDGSTFPMDLAVSEMQLVDRRMFTGIVRDITERVKIERMKSEFISTVSHELRTPLTSIRGSLALIVGGVVGELPPAVKPLVEIAHKNSERLILLVNDILDMEKIEAGKMEFDMQPINLMPLVEQAMDGNRAYGEQFRVSYELESALPDVMIKADANRLMQVFANLLSNAAKFSSSGGKVMIAVERIGQHIRVSVKDNGPGIPDEFKAQIFQKFAQADASDTKKKGGTGLGLSITKEIIEQMGGSIGFTSQPNVLTAFFVEFPAWQEVQISTPVLSDTAGRKRVLICEDDRDIAALLRLMLEQAGLAADIAYDAAQAKQLLAQQTYAAMTLDLSMPHRDGLSLIRELRADKATAALPIVVVSANAVEGRKELNGDAFSVIDWIGKPIDQVKLVEALKQAVGQVSDVRSQVLHVEDDQDIAHVVTAIVGESADVDNAPTLAEARRMLKAKHYDLAILDMSLPDGSGLDLLPELNSAAPAIPVMVFSASEVMHEDLSKIKSALVKSRTDNAQLLATIKRLIGDA